MIRRKLLALLLLCGVLFVARAPRLAHAQALAPPASEVKEAARAAANRGLQLFQAGRHEEAIAAFREVEALFHAPTIVVMIGRAFDKLGRLLEARAVYEQVRDEQLAHYAPPEFFEAQAEAREELAALERRIPTVQITVADIGASEVSAQIDGAAALVDAAVPQNPGEHTVTVSAPGRVTATRRVLLREGEAAQVALELPREPPPAASPPHARAAPRPGAPRPAPPLPPPDRASVAPAVAAFGVAGLALGIGAVTGLASLGEVATLDVRCPARRCYDDAAEPYDTAHALATVSTVSFVVSGVAAATGSALLLWPRGGQQRAATAVVAGPAWLGVRGRF